jgi:hypothetical protein
MEQGDEISQHYFHYFEEFPGSFCLIAPSEVNPNAIVFVHGFGGDAAETWSYFQQMIDDSDWSSSFASTDLFFVQYSSVWQRIQASTNWLLKFLALPAI